MPGRFTVTLTRLYELAATPTADLEPLEIDTELEPLAPDIIPYAVEIVHRAKPVQADAPAGPAKRRHPKVGRNDPYPCGSDKRFKTCCLQ